MSESPANGDPGDATPGRMRPSDSSGGAPSDPSRDGGAARDGSDPDATWYDGGLRFTCTQCGNCCTGPPGAVWFDDDEARAMAGVLGLTEKAFRARYARRIGRRWSLEERLHDGKYDCILLDRSGGGRATCSVYGARPTQCRTWPFWPENLRDRDAWEAARDGTPCPGMDRGTLVPIEAIRIQRDEQAAVDTGDGGAARRD